MNKDATTVERGSFTDAQLDFNRPANEQIASWLKSAILSMELVPGQMISEAEIGQIFGASRTPVREAFAQLREERLIVTWPSRGTFVSRLSVAQIKGAQFLRESLEAAVVERLCAKGLPAQAAATLKDNLARQRRAVDKGDTVGFRDLDDGFHAILAQATQFDRIGAVLTREKAVLDRLRVLALDSTAHRGRLLEDHRQIAQAILARDATSAVAHSRQHLRRVLNTLSDLVAANHSYFDFDDATKTSQDHA
ncbi:GntR family transcriptional regulator [Octadecabacter sp. SW4]|uniref:GntR family transcriptional regulator n=1 Tax=Octadecabacter sp. SW4 TaxID=2602067 RepID=UPI0011C1F006|nr:GntR family transcriptional regulator [Octadecabacter sp. SW4]QEE34791.1 GntR family transcriptional regulator [Octadecabacter sp. SW4]